MTSRRAAVVIVVLAAVFLNGCSPKPAAETHEAPTLNVTHWTDRSELYMEYPPLVAGGTALFAVHLTTLNDFKPVSEGQARLEFVPESGGPPSALTGPKPSRPGAFRVEGAPPAAGRYRWALVLNSAAINDRHDLGTVQIFADAATANAEAGKKPPDDAAAISYLKEQQWTNEFATAPVLDADLRRSVRVPAVLDAISGGEAVVSAPAAGRFMAARLPSIGDRVQAGTELGRVEPRMTAIGDRPTFVSDLAEARATLEAARIDQARAEQLLAERAVPARRVEEANRSAAVAEARLKAAEMRLAQRDETLRSGGGASGGNAFTLRAPISGRITEVRATLGAAYDEDVPLFKVARTDMVELKAFVPAAEITAVRGLTAVALEVPGRSEPLSLRFDHVHDPGVLDPVTRALPIQMNVQNVGGELVIGQSGTAILYVGGVQRLRAMPKTAVLMEAGRPYVFVQAGGEKFLRRYIEIAARDGDLIGVKAGLQPGDRVVTRGAYEVQLASAAKGLPAEGHVH